MHRSRTTWFSLPTRFARRAVSALIPVAVVGRVRLLIGLATVVALVGLQSPTAVAATPPWSPFVIAQWSGFLTNNTDVAEPDPPGGLVSTLDKTYRSVTHYNKTAKPTIFGTVQSHKHTESQSGAVVCKTDEWWPDDTGEPVRIPTTVVPDDATHGTVGFFFPRAGNAYAVSPAALFDVTIPILTIHSGDPTGVRCPPDARIPGTGIISFPFTALAGEGTLPANPTRLEGSSSVMPFNTHATQHFCWRLTWLPDRDLDGIPDAEDPAPAAAAPAPCNAIGPAPSAAACVTSALASAKVTKAATLLKHRGFQITCHAPAPGTLTVALTTVVRRHRITIAILKLKVAKAGTVTRTVRLTKAGRRLLRRSRRPIRATLKVSYTIGAHTTTKSRVANIAPVKR